MAGAVTVRSPVAREAEGSRTPGKVVKAPDHKIQHDKAWGSTVTNMTSEPVTSMEQVAALMTRHLPHTRANLG